MTDDTFKEINEDQEPNNSTSENGQFETTQDDSHLQSINANSDTDESNYINHNVDGVQENEFIQNQTEEKNTGSDSSDETTEDNDSLVQGAEEVEEATDGNVNFISTPSEAENTIPNQNPWQAQSFQNTAGQNPNNINRSNYYKESFKKQPKQSDFWKYALVSLVSAIVGGAFLTAMLLGVAPVLQPQLKSIVGSSSQKSDTGSVQSDYAGVKKIEIVQNSDSAVTSVAEKVGPSVVGIRTTYQSTNELFGEQSGIGEGSGIIISENGFILTNHHVIENALNDQNRKIRNSAKIQVFLPKRINKPYTATVQGYDSKTDLAVLKIDETNLTPIEFGDSDKLKVGEVAIAFGNPGGLEYMGSLTTGVVSGLNRTVQLDNGKKIKLVQTDAAINPGNSGGALVNIKGQLIGVNTIKIAATGFEGLGFAIPVNEAKKIADELIQKTYILKPYLGIKVNNNYTEEFAKAKHMPMGVFVEDVEILGAAQKAGIKPLDVITKFNNVTVSSYDELEEQKNKFKPGDVVDVEVYRDGARKVLKVKLGETK
jgi:serine protease Do